MARKNVYNNSNELSRNDAEAAKVGDMNAMKQPKKRGVGRPRKPDDQKLVQLHLRVSPETRSVIDAIGTERARKIVDSALRRVRGSFHR